MTKAEYLAQLQQLVAYAEQDQKYYEVSAGRGFERLEKLRVREAAVIAMDENLFNQVSQAFLDDRSQETVGAGLAAPLGRL